MTDYPAAHSMDSTWFAVDEDGEVAIFETGEGGAVPASGFPLGGEAGASGRGLEDAGLLARALHSRAATDPRLRAMLPESAEELEGRLAEGDGWDLVQPLLRSVGIWTYVCDEAVATPYVREGEAHRPVRLADLDPGLRAMFAGARLPLRFSDAPTIAPGEHGPVEAWDPVWLDTAGRPHPIPGREDEFEEVAADAEEWAADLVVEARAGKVLDGEAFYAAVAKAVGDLDEPWTPPSRGLGERVIGWLVDRLRRP